MKRTNKSLILKKSSLEFRNKQVHILFSDSDCCVTNRQINMKNLAILENQKAKPCILIFCYKPNPKN